MRIETLGFGLLLGCGQTQEPPADIAFTCGDAGAICHSSTQYCDIVTSSGDVSKDSGASASTSSGCAPLVDSCTTCNCLVDAGLPNSCGGAGGHSVCTSSENILTVTETCPF